MQVKKVKRNAELTLWERIYLPEIMRGMMITSRHFFENLVGFLPGLRPKGKKRRIFTVYYPEERFPIPIAYRGMPVLVEDNGEERCVACGLCEAICPAKCIYIMPGDMPGKRDRYPVIFELNVARCVVCGFCEEVCPKEAIVMSDELEIANLDRKKMVLQKAQLMRPASLVEKRLLFTREIYR